MSRFAALFRLALILALAGLCGLPLAAQAEACSRGSNLCEVAASDLPREARETLALIRQGGPFPFPGKDGSIFGNFEQRLPVQPRGYYREFTVPTPGRQDRGARRIIAGSGPSRSVANSGESYYTADHYRTFRRIRE